MEDGRLSVSHHLLLYRLHIVHRTYGCLLMYWHCSTWYTCVWHEKSIPVFRWIQHPSPRSTATSIRMFLHEHRRMVAGLLDYSTWQTTCSDAPSSLTPANVDCEEARSCHIISIQGHLAFLFSTKHEKQRLTINRAVAHWLLYVHQYMIPGIRYTLEGKNYKLRIMRTAYSEYNCSTSSLG